MTQTVKTIPIDLTLLNDHIAAENANGGLVSLIENTSDPSTILCISTFEPPIMWQQSLSIVDIDDTIITNELDSYNTSGYICAMMTNSADSSKIIILANKHI